MNTVLSWPVIGAAGVLTCWLIFGIAFLARYKTRTGIMQQRDGWSILGLCIQAAALLLIWSLRRPWGAPLYHSSGTGGQAFTAILAIVMAGASIWLMREASRELGQQFAVRAAIMQNHQLITSGPYGFVRHPIYTALLGLLLATGFAFSRWIIIFPALILYMIGTGLRTGREEKLLHQTFGVEFEEYTRRVPTIIPGLRRKW
jgi:protein-S-isoprenylcysteine O-methyltransferase Ste14